MALERFIPKSPDANIRNTQDFEVAKFGHLNTIVEYINNNSAKPAGLNGYVQFNDNNALGGDAGLFWDNVNKRLGVGTVTPGAVLEIYGGVDTLGISGPANQAKSIQIARYNNSSFQSHYIGDDGGAFFGAGLTISASGSNSQIYLQVSAAGRNVNIGSAGQTLLPKDLGARLGVRGSGSTSATTALLVQNSGGTNLLQVKDNGDSVIYGDNITWGQGFGYLLRQGGGIVYGSNHNSVILKSAVHWSLQNNSGFIGASNGTIDYSSTNTPNVEQTNILRASQYQHGVGEGRFLIQAQANAGGYNAIGNMYIAGGRNTNGGAHGNVYLGVDLTGALGNVGIGTTTLTARLQVKSSGTTAATTSLLTQNSAGTTTFSVADDGNILVGASTITFGSNIYFNRITSNFGGVTYDNDGIGGVFASYTNGRFSTNDRVGFGAVNNNLSRVYIMGTGSTSATTSLLVQNSSGTTALSVNDAGNVLIGTTTDSGQKLQINGTVSSETNNGVFGDIILDYGGGTRRIRPGGNSLDLTDVFGNRAFQVNQNAIPRIALDFDGVTFCRNLVSLQYSLGSTQQTVFTGSNYVGHLTPFFDIKATGYANSKNTDLRLYTDNTTSGTYGNIIIGHNGTNATGNVGIGTTTPTARLQVDGDMNFSGGSAATQRQILFQGQGIKIKHNTNGLGNNIIIGWNNDDLPIDSTTQRSTIIGFQNTGNIASSSLILGAINRLDNYTGGTNIIVGNGLSLTATTSGTGKYFGCEGGVGAAFNGIFALSTFNGLPANTEPGVPVIIGTGQNNQTFNNPTICLGQFQHDNTLPSSSRNNHITTTNGVGTDIEGYNLIISTGKSTGSATPKDLIFATTTALASGTTRQTLSARWYIKGGTGALANVASPTAQLQVQGSGSTSATTSLLVQNSAGTTGFSVRDDSSVLINSRVDSVDTTIIFRAVTTTALTLTASTTTVGNHTAFSNGSLTDLVNGNYFFRHSTSGNSFDFRDPTRVFLTTNNSGTLIQNTSFGGTAIEASALLEVQSTNKGFLPPRMTTAQRTAISSPAAGLVVFDTTLQNLCYYRDGVWVQATFTAA